MHNILGKTQVNIVNSLEGNLDLTVHCKSADDDLGAHLLHHGGSFGFSFNPKFIIIGTTQFYIPHKKSE
jgi:hypothetical protein